MDVRVIDDGCDQYVALVLLWRRRLLLLPRLLWRRRVVGRALRVAEVG
ncbi:hypothetical protein TIFTF001_023694 [Ficus carica]|uniref:Uncharacterized protein n=1 Tax=Ficus carica TaxID=3494 RepID=A0AA88ALF1_FICCA|nr:hypothetical protein TIFTF001_023694 [Ficus carica]